MKEEELTEEQRARRSAELPGIGQAMWLKLLPAVTQFLAGRRDPQTRDTLQKSIDAAFEEAWLAGYNARLEEDEEERFHDKVDRDLAER